MNGTVGDLLGLLLAINEKTKTHRSTHLVDEDNKPSGFYQTNDTILIRPREITRMINFVRSLHTNQIPLPIDDLRALSGCNNVKFSTARDESTLRLSASENHGDDIMETETWDHKCGVWVRSLKFPMNPKIDIRSCMCCGPNSALVMPDVKILMYRCDCNSTCGCKTLRIPTKFSGQTLVIYRNDNRGFTVSQKEYEEYVQFKAFYTFDPEMIIRAPDGLRIDYEKYYANLLGTDYGNALFRVNHRGIIQKNKTGIPLVTQVVDDFGPMEYEYHFSNFETLKSDVEQIRKVIPVNLVLKLVPEY